MPIQPAHSQAAPAASILRVTLLGHMAAEDAAGRSVLPRARKARAILAILVLAAPRPVLRLQLAGLLWSQRHRNQAQASLRQAVHELQEVLVPLPGHLLLADRHHLALRNEGLWLDTIEATRADGAHPERLDLFRNVLLEDLPGLDPAFDRWLDEERSRLMLTARGIGERILSEQYDPEARLAAAERLLAIDGAHEGAWRMVIRTMADRGDRSAAIAAFERCRSALAAASQVSPSSETEELIARIRAAVSDPGTRGRDTGGGRETSPAQPGGFVGRDKRPGVRLGIPPLRTIGATAEDELSIGLAEEITTGLSRVRGISCISGTSLAAIVGDSRPDAMSRWDLDMDFLLDGTIQRSADQVRVIARLLDMHSAGAVVWAGRFDRRHVDTLTLQDEIGAAIVAQVDPELLIHQGERAALRRLIDPTAQDLMVQAIPAIYRLERGGFHTAGRLLENALAVDPRNSGAHAWYAYWYMFLVGQGWTRDSEAASLRAAELAERAVTLDSSNARALTLAGQVRAFLGKRPEEASALHERALALNPHLALAWCFSGLTHSYIGLHEEAIRRIQHAIALSPRDPHRFFFDMSLIMPHLLLGENEHAVRIGRQAIELNPGFASSYKGLLSALGHLHRDREAARVRARLLVLEPDFSVEAAVGRSAISRLEDLQTYANGLRKAGLPETVRLALPGRPEKVAVRESVRLHRHGLAHQGARTEPGGLVVPGPHL